MITADGSGYTDDGREVFDDDPNESENQSEFFFIIALRVLIYTIHFIALI